MSTPCRLNVDAIAEAMSMNVDSFKTELAVRANAEILFALCTSRRIASIGGSANTPYVADEVILRATGGSANTPYGADTKTSASES